MSISAVPTVVSALPSDRERSVATLVTAFTQDPFIRWMLPDAQQFLAYFPQVLKFFAGRAFENASAYRSHDYVATALWLPPGVHPDEESLGGVMQDAVDDALQKEVFEVLDQVGGSHPDVEHWYLPALGVDPRCQGMGYGSAILAQGLKVCDRNHVAAYLEATNQRNVPFYRKFGFEVVGKIQAGSSPAIVPMLRSAR
ncbi:MAG: GNAT family N-acetyltransferase [Nitrospirota bacterium]